MRLNKESALHLALSVFSFIIPSTIIADDGFVMADVTCDRAVAIEKVQTYLDAVTRYEGHVFTVGRLPENPCTITIEY